MVDWTTLGIGIAGVAGTVVGSLVGGIVGFFGPSWNEQRLIRVRDDRAARRALRLLSQELTFLVIAMDVLLKHPGPGGFPVSFFVNRLDEDTSQWEKDKETLATVLEDNDTWQVLADFYDHIKGFRLAVGGRLAEDLQTAGVLDQFTTMRDGGRDARDRINKILGTNKAPGGA